MMIYLEIIEVCATHIISYDMIRYDTIRYDTIRYDIYGIVARISACIFGMNHPHMTICHGCKT